MKIKFNKDVGVGIGLALLGLASTVLGNVKEKSARESLKSELKDELMKDLLKSKMEES